MRRNFAPSILAVLLAVIALSPHLDHALAQAGTYTMQAGETLNVACASGLSGVVNQQTATLVCATLVPTPIATATMTPTMTMTPTNTPVVMGWHPPTTHEHGDAPPQWVLDSAQQPFTQTREAHEGYKGVLASLPNGVQSYFTNHILSTTMARSHGDHDYQLWIRDRSGGVSYWQGQMDFGSPPPLKTVDDGTRPVILSVGDGSCETWYSRAGSTVMDVGLTICGRYQAFSGAILGGNGTYRTSDWAIPADRLSVASYGGHVAPTLARDCITEFGVCRFRFLVNSKQYPGSAVVPVN